MEERIQDFTVKANNGKDFPFGQLEGKAILVVNTASKCGFTPQYKGLEELYRKYKDRGLVVVGFPCDQFAHQEPGSDADIKGFCEINFGVTFPLMSKVEVNGPGTHPLYAWLKSQAHGFLGSRIKWNFTKFLVGKDGRTVKRYAPTVTPLELEHDIEAALAR
jgi:glutathione peroxidase